MLEVTKQVFERILSVEFLLIVIALFVFIRTKKETVDKFTEKAMSREFIIWIIATLLLLRNILPPEMWLLYSGGFAGLRHWQKLKEHKR